MLTPLSVLLFWEEPNLWGLAVRQKGQDYLDLRGMMFHRADTTKEKMYLLVPLDDIIIWSTMYPHLYMNRFTTHVIKGKLDFHTEILGVLY